MIQKTSCHPSNDLYHLIYFNICLCLSNVLSHHIMIWYHRLLKNDIKLTKQAERLKSRERRAKVDRLDGQWLDGQ